MVPFMSHEFRWLETMGFNQVDADAALKASGEDTGDWSGKSHGKWVTFFCILRGKNGGTLLDFEVFPSFSKWQWKITHFVYGFPNEICMVIKYCDCHYQIWSTQKHLAIPERTHEWSSLRFSGKFVSQTRQEYID